MLEKLAWPSMSLKEPTMITDTATSFARKEKGTKFQQEILDSILQQCTLLKKEDLQSAPASATK